MSEELNTNFRDARGRDWTVRLTVGVVCQFCRDHRLKMSDLSPDKLDVSQLIDLAFLGTRHQSRAAIEGRDEFFAALEGEPFIKAQEAAASAIVNFILRSLPKSERSAAVEKIKEATAGLSPTPLNLADTPELIQQDSASGN